MNQEEAVDRFMILLKNWASTIHYRQTRGQITVKSRASQQHGMAALLCMSEGNLTVLGGAELDKNLLSMPLPYTAVILMPERDNMLELKVNLPKTNEQPLRNGIFVEVRDRSARERWLAALSVMHVKIEGWCPSAPTVEIARIGKVKPFFMKGAVPLVRWIS